ncbi:hypothetical protein PV356_35255 [Streptomyces sp. WI03-5b]|uniref:hypothetical protein n=1 Tax=Streptomyces sp. WI03-5b TaxID=462946 RepID=UPI0029B7D739|nr:hypothetical protein [Streptomyces sp. WI03-5b]MDX2624679.1 hypothetical protein [Streptomyces sp. WI03-5b]
MKPSRHHLTRCRRCGAPICWALTSANGRRQPIDAEPTEAGNLAVMQAADGVLYVRAVTAARPEIRPGEWQAMPHHATCTSPPPRRSSSSGQRARSGVRPVPWAQR